MVFLLASVGTGSRLSSRCACNSFRTRGSSMSASKHLRAPSSLTSRSLRRFGRSATHSSNAYLLGLSMRSGGETGGTLMSSPLPGFSASRKCAMTMAAWFRRTMSSAGSRRGANAAKAVVLKTFSSSQMDCRLCLVKAKRKAGSSAAHLTSCTQVSCRYVVSSSLCSSCDSGSRECLSTSFLPAVSKETTLRAQTAASRTLASLCLRYQVMTLTASAFRVSRRPSAWLPQNQRRRMACRTISMDSGRVITGIPVSNGIRPSKVTTFAMRPTPSISLMPTLAYIATAAKVFKSIMRQIPRGRVAGSSGSVAQR
mmetsp:Transcript_66688/g.145412  ORF Transcript_66688/g.145412 Transcript_66688/m.145412 type:complete len:312 (+) Transcript_66688:95-1030(+)